MKRALIHRILETSKGKEMKLHVMARPKYYYHFISQFIIPDKNYLCVISNKNILNNSNERK